MFFTSIKEINMFRKGVSRLLSKEVNTLRKEINRPLNKGINSLKKEVNKYLSRGMSNVCLKVTVDFISSKDSSPGQILEAPPHGVSLNFKNSYCSLKIRGLGEKLCVAFLLF